MRGSALTASAGSCPTFAAFWSPGQLESGAGPGSDGWGLVLGAVALLRPLSTATAVSWARIEWLGSPGAFGAVSPSPEVSKLVDRSRADRGPVLPKGVFRGEGQASCHEHQIHVIVSGTSEGDFWRYLEMWDKVGSGSIGRSGVGSTRTSGVEGADWRRRGDALMQVTGQLCDNSVSRIEIPQDGTMAVADPVQAVDIADSSDGGAEMLLVDS
ncbi:hypothetical protein NDU88_002120 [Pleurodeles waltl]|uniref:Uncharacterized protein n=1 Tax=Pleurodeles waltl TaxID=8319 RepID=A0AAV7RB04_PLEWA|nr:hypothetical protein NDU88_002120 [Pleurodeles waltl]